MEGVKAGAKRRIVILGGGFAGAYCAQKLCRRLAADWEITLLDRNNFLLFYPLLVEAGVGSLEPRHVVVPIRKFMRGGDFRMGDAVGVDLRSQQIHFRPVGLDQTDALHFDHLVISLGSVTKVPDLPGLKEFGFELKNLADGIQLRDRCIRLLECANNLRDRNIQRAILRVVIVGANFTGMELAGEYLEFLKDTCRAYPNIHHEDIEVMVVEFADRILAAIDEGLARYAREQLEKKGMIFKTKTTLTEVREDQVTLTTGQVVPTYTTVWCAGIAPNPLLQKIEGLPLDKKGYIDCEKSLRVNGFDNVWAVGDCALVPDKDGKAHAATAQIATREGTVAAQNILRAISGEELQPFVYEEMGSIAALGGHTAVAKLMGIRLAGFPAWFVYRTVYVLKMPSWSRRFRVVADWTLDLFFRREAIQLGTCVEDPLFRHGPISTAPVAQPSENGPA